MMGELFFAALTFLVRCGLGADLMKRAAWLQNSSRRVLRVFGVRCKVSGTIPSTGLLVTNHLSYLDILVLAATTPAVFVSKREVKFWPIFGWFACLAGTIFVNRERRTLVGELNEQIQTALDAGALVVLFPEGTSSNGESVLPFKSSLIEPATQPTHPLSVGWIHYELNDGDVGEEICYWRDMTFFPHAVNLLGKRCVRAFICFAPVQHRSADRKQLALQLHAAVTALKSNFTN